ncbi:hypothetical protein MUP00_09345 [Candidatus Bathyarchaeota archaeon]|nr:hypothetical protein [Candidatus Bathyarchaeota archaeon]
MLQFGVDAIGTNRLDIVLPLAQQLGSQTSVGNGMKGKVLSSHGLPKAKRML